MKEIKFRAWLEPRWDEDYDANKMYYDIQNSYDMLCDVKPRDIMDSFSSWLNEEHATVEQYTGLKDKNDKEIYEGDIIKVDSDKLMIPHEHTTKASEVSYSNYQTAFVYRTWYGEIPVGRHDTSVEVIGNIHENPELLGEK